MDERQRSCPSGKVLRGRCVAVGVFLGFALSLGAEQKDIRDLLPPQEVVNPWTAADKPLSYRADNLYNLINGGAEVYLEYGFVQVISQEYVQGEDSLILTIYEMKDPQAAFGVFSYSRSPKKSPLSLGDGSYKGGFQIAFWQDRYFVLVESFSLSDKTEHALLSFGRSVSHSIGDHADEPAILRRFPRQRLVQGSEKLLKGRLAVASLFFLEEADPFQLDKDDLVLYGEYDGPPGRAKLFLVIYGQPEKASRVHPLLQEAFSPEKGYRSLGRQGALSSWVKEDRYFVLRREADSLALITEAASLKEAQEIIRQSSKPH